MTTELELNRRTFMAGALSLAPAVSLIGPKRLAAAEPQGPFKICAFIKFLQSLSHEQLAETIAKLGFDGIEATVRDGGHVLPERVEDDLPRLIEALNKHDLEITVMSSSVNSIDQPHTEKVLRTASRLGVKRYRMAYYRYDLSKPVSEQLEELRPLIKDLVAINRELGLQALYQNHSGARFVGAAIWDLHDLIKEYSVDDIGIAFDIRHATVEGGLAWPVHFNLVRQRLGAVYFKDFRWDGRRPENVPLGEGQVDPAFVPLLKQSDFSGPISLHVEYLPDAGIEPNVAALRKDLATLRQWLNAR